MDNRLFFGFATTIKERATLLNGSGDKECLKRWRARKTLLTEEMFKYLLSQYNITEDNYCRAISELNEEDLEILYHHIEKQDWYKLHKRLFLTEITVGNELKTALRFHINYFETEMRKATEKHLLICVSERALSQLVDSVRDELSYIAMRTLVWDVHEFSERINLKTEDKDIELSAYIEKRFKDSRHTQDFFCEYPTLSKILAIRLQYAIDNYLYFLDTISNNIVSISELFGISKPYEISDVKCNLGDSHNKGKAPIIFAVNTHRLVFKFRSGNIVHAYNHLLAYLESLDSKFCFKKVRVYSGKDFSVEEFIEHKSCKSQAEVKQYYRNYGFLVALAYWLNSSDLHMENVIAHGEYPVIIDVETILEADVRRNYGVPVTKSFLADRCSIALTGLLPMKKYWERQIEVSALNGQAQRLPFKVRKLVNESTIDIRYELDSAYIKDGNNIPILNNEKTDYKYYAGDIEKGFVKMAHLILQHKESFIDKVIHLFAGKTIRVILRDTQDYQNFLMFSNHPSCMTDYIEREKVLENLWQSYFVTKQISLAELQALLSNDIPYFCADMSKDSLFSESYYFESSLYSTPIDEFRKRCQNFSKCSLRQTQGLIRENLGLLDINLRTLEIVDISNSDLEPYEAAELIGKYILEHIEINEKYNMVTWPELNYDENEIIMSYPDSNLFNGTGGLLLFYRTLQHFNPNHTNKTLIRVLENEVFGKPLPNQEYSSAFYGYGCRMTVAIYIYELTGESKYKGWLAESLDCLLKEEPADRIDWLRGNASIMALLSRAYSIIPSQDIIDYIVKIIPNKENIEQLHNVGFANGYAGIMYGLSKVREHVDVAVLIEYLQKRILNMLRLQDDLQPTWDTGSLGIRYALEEIQNQDSIPSLNFNSEQLIEACLCHGYSGLIDYYIEQVRKGIISAKEVQDFFIRKKMYAPKLMMDSHFLPIGLFNGLAGVGYQLLRAMSPDNVLSILFI